MNRLLPLLLPALLVACGTTTSPTPSPTSPPTSSPTPPITPSPVINSAPNGAYGGTYTVNGASYPVQLQLNATGDVNATKVSVKVGNTWVAQTVTDYSFDDLQSSVDISFQFRTTPCGPTSDDLMLFGPFDSKQNRIEGAATSASSMEPGTFDVASTQQPVTPAACP